MTKRATLEELKAIIAEHAPVMFPSPESQVDVVGALICLAFLLSDESDLDLQPDEVAGWAFRKYLSFEAATVKAKIN